MEFFKKIKRSNPLEPSLGISGFFFLTILFVGFFFYLDYCSVATTLRSHGFVWFGFHVSSPSLLSSKVDSGSLRIGYLDEDEDGCDLFDGNWVWDETYPFYQSQNCSFTDEGFKCSENGRPDSFFTKWRWQPRRCNLPRFNATNMLEKLRNKRLVFVGDSIGRNQWESMLCMLSSVIHNKSSIYEVNGSPISKHLGFLVLKFDEFNCTVEYYRSPFLVIQGHPPKNASHKVKLTLKLDQMDWTSNQWKDADILVLNAGHWWNYEKTLKVDCYFQEGNEVKLNMSIDSAFQRSIRTVVDWIKNEVNTNKTYVLFRTYAPVHFRGGEWNTGGGCHLETLPDLGPLPVLHDIHYESVIDVLSDHVNKSYNSGKILDLLNVTSMTLRRKDGHPSIYYQGLKMGPAPFHRQDCSHWCLPGVPDSWNELVYALFLKWELSRFQNSTKQHSPL